MADEKRADNHRLEFIIDDEPFDLGVKVRVVGVGDAAGKVFDHLRRNPIKDAELILIDADRSPLRQSNVTNENVTDETNASSAGDHGPVKIDHAPPAIAHSPVEIDQVAALLDGASLVIIVTALGDNTTDLTQTIAALSTGRDALTIAVATTPLDCLEQQARKLAERELNALANAVDGLIHVPMADYRRLIPDAKTPAEIRDGIALVLSRAVRALLKPLTDRGENLICIDLGDLRYLVRAQPRCALAVGYGYGGDRASASVRAAVGTNGLLVGGARLSEAKGVWVVFEADESLALIEVNEALTPIQNWVSSDADVVFGAYVAPAMGQEFRVTILVTGHEKFGFQSPPNYHARTI